MFLKRRALQAEYFDAPDRSLEVMTGDYRRLTQVNRLFLLSRSFKKLLPELLGEDRCRSLSILDLGAGDCALGNELSRWAAGMGWNWRITNLDINPRALQLHNPRLAVAGSALALPFRDAAFEVVIASQMTHHFTSESEACQHFREAWRVSKRLLLLNDLHRNLAFYLALGMVLKVAGSPTQFFSDGLLSVRKGWRLSEWRAMAAQAGIGNAKVWLYAGTRIMLAARKQA
jgi:ubiquinone/menaquinone biosynthesis C-methylase UbiE